MQLCMGLPFYSTGSAPLGTASLIKRNFGFAAKFGWGKGVGKIAKIPYIAA